MNLQHDLGLPTMSTNDMLESTEVVDTVSPESRLWVHVITHFLHDYGFLVRHISKVPRPNLRHIQELERMQNELNSAHMEEICDNIGIDVSWLCKRVHAIESMYSVGDINDLMQKGVSGGKFRMRTD